MEESGEGGRALGRQVSNGRWAGRWGGLSETVAWWHGLGWSFKSAVAGQMNRREISCGWVAKLNLLGLGVAGGGPCSETPTPLL